MLIALIFIFLALPALEIYLFIVVGGLIGPLPTVALTLLAAALGALVIRVQGVEAVGRVQDALRRHEAPVMEVMDGLAVFLAGALLIIPGFFTDFLALILLVPWLRRNLGMAALWAVLAARTPRRAPPSGDVIDADFEVVSRRGEPRGGRDPGRIAPP